jgi:cell division protein FtsB
MLRAWAKSSANKPENTFTMLNRLRKEIAKLTEENGQLRQEHARLSEENAQLHSKLEELDRFIDRL